MTDRGTRSAAQVLSSRNVVPQERRRLYIVCFRIDNEACSRRGPLSGGGGAAAAAAAAAAPSASEGGEGVGSRKHEPVRLADRDGAARTLIASYRNAHSCHLRVISEHGDRNPDLAEIIQSRCCDADIDTECS
jgi:site-specific DNA-cytosine methylase